MTWRSVVWLGLTLLGLASLGLASLCLVGLGLTWFGVVWFDFGGGGHGRAWALSVVYHMEGGLFFCQTILF